MANTPDNTVPPSGQHIDSITIEQEMQKSYLDYAMSVIVSRALPDVRDGLKPVHRRILYAMKEGGYDSTKPFRKSARIVGDVMGKYHPHGDSAIYDALVRMAQDFSMRLPLISGQGNFGSMDGDNAAAMRYTEARLAKVAEELLADIEKNTVDFRPNYDESDQEPIVLPARYPNMLVNGGSGIAVGMATNIPPHNLGEVIDACCAYIDNPAISAEELIEIIPGPDFPTGGFILGRKGIMDAYLKGKGSVMMRAKTKFEPLPQGRTAIIVTEIPYQVNKSSLVKRINEVGAEKIVEGISAAYDYSDRDGVRISIELKRDAEPEIVLNQLFTHTSLQTSFGVNTVALLHGQPQTLTLHDIIKAFVEFREEVITRRTIFDLNKARDKAHILLGLAVAVANIDEIIRIIRHSPDPATAKQQLMARAWPAENIVALIRLVDEDAVRDDNTYYLSETQTKAILDLRLHRLTGLERDKIANDLKTVTSEIAYLLSILADRQKLMDVMKQELLEVRTQFANPRRTELIDSEFEQDIEDLIAREDMVVTVSHNGYIKRVPLSSYRAQKRGGKGKSSMSFRESDFVSVMFVADTHTPILFFTNFGKVYQAKVYNLPLGNAQAKGKPMVQMFSSLSPGERVAAVLPLVGDEETWAGQSIVFATNTGQIRRNELKEFVNIRANGKMAMKLESGEKLVDVKICTDTDDVFIATKQGRCIRFPVTDVRVFFSRASTGVRGIKLLAKDEVITMSILRHVDITMEEREAYKAASSAANSNRDDTTGNDDEPKALLSDAVTLSEERYKFLAEQEQFLLTVTDHGFGKRSSTYEYRTIGRGGQGFACMELTRKNGKLAAAFPVGDKDQVMLVTNGGQMIRCAVHDIRIASRKTQGVTLFKVASGEQVVSVAHLAETEEEDISESEI